MSPLVPTVKRWGWSACVLPLMPQVEAVVIGQWFPLGQWPVRQETLTEAQRPACCWLDERQIKHCPQSLSMLLPSAQLVCVFVWLLGGIGPWSRQMALSFSLGVGVRFHCGPMGQHILSYCPPAHTHSSTIPSINLNQLTLKSKVHISLNSPKTHFSIHPSTVCRKIVKISFPFELFNPWWTAGLFF